MAESSPEICWLVVGTQLATNVALCTDLLMTWRRFFELHACPMSLGGMTTHSTSSIIHYVLLLASHEMEFVKTTSSRRCSINLCCQCLLPGFTKFFLWPVPIRREKQLTARQSIIKGGVDDATFDRLTWQFIMDWLVWGVDYYKAIVNLDKTCNVLCLFIWFRLYIYLVNRTLLRFIEGYRNSTHSLMLR